MKLIFIQFLKTIKKYPKECLLSFFFILITTILNTIIPYGLREYLNKISINTNYIFIAIGILAFAIVLIFQTFMKICFYVSLDSLGGKFLENTTIACEEKLAKTSFNEIDKITIPTIKHILFGDLLDGLKIIGHRIPMLFSSLFLIIVSLVIALFYSIELTLLIFISLILGIILSICSRKMISKTAGQTNAKIKQYHSLINQFTDSLILVQTNDILPYYTDKTKNTINEFINCAKKEDKMIYFWSGILDNYNALVIIILSIFLALPVAGNSIINMVFFTYISNMIMNEGQKVENYLQAIVKSQVSFENINYILKLENRQLKY